jgi:hypothetical protein
MNTQGTVAMKEPQLNPQPWKVEFNFAPKELPEEVRKSLGSYFAGGGIPKDPHNWKPPTKMAPANVLESAQRAAEALKALFEQAFWYGDKVAAWCLAGKLCVAVDSLKTLTNRDVALLADFARTMPKFPLNCAPSARIRNENEGLLNRLHVGEQFSFKPAKRDSAMQVFAQEIISQLIVARLQFALRYLDATERQSVLADCDEIERRLINLPELVAGSVTHILARAWFDVAWSVLNRQTGKCPEKLPQLKRAWNQISQHRDKEQWKYYLAHHPGKSKSRQSTGYKKVINRTTKTVETNLRQKLRQRVGEAFFALLGLRFKST